VADHFDFLRDVYFFKDLSDDEIRGVEHLCKEDHFEPGEILFRENAPAERFFIVLEGMVEVWKDYGSPTPDLLAVHGQGHLFGEMALIDDLPRSATVVAKTSTTVLYMFRAEFDRILRENSAVALSILRSLSAMVRKSNESYVEDLRQRNEKLEAAYNELQAAQEELLRAERFSNLGKMSSMILHDIRNPISVVKGLGEMIQLTLDDPERVRECANAIVSEAERLNRLAGELLDYSRGEIRLDIKASSMDNMLAKLVERVSQRARSMEFSIDNKVTEPLLVDEERLLRALENVAGNACKASGNKGRIEIRAWPEGERVRITLKDSGEGMPPEVLARVFEPFFSASRGGTGLGLVIVKNVVEAHRGELRVESKVGEGTSVTIDLPSRN